MRRFLFILVFMGVLSWLAAAQVKGGVAGGVKLPPPVQPQPPISHPIDLGGTPVVIAPILPAPIAAAPIAPAPVAPIFVAPPAACRAVDTAACAAEAMTCLVNAWLEDTHTVYGAPQSPYVYQYAAASDADVEAASQCGADLSSCLRPHC